MQEIIQRTLIYSLSILVVKIISLISCPKEMTVIVSWCFEAYHISNKIKE